MKIERNDLQIYSHTKKIQIQKKNAQQLGEFESGKYNKCEGNNNWI
jgi:hypothetical protein